MNRFLRNGLLGAGVTLAAVGLVAYFGFWRWMVCRVEVPPGSSLLLRYKGPWPFGGVAQVPEGTLVQLDAKGRPTSVGILEQMPGPGRHFYSPLVFERQIVPDNVIEPGKIGLVTAKVGKDLPAGTYVADAGFKGIQRKLLTPGRYRINPYGYQVDALPVSACVGTRSGVKYGEKDSTLIPPGYVGVVTNLQPAAGESAGIQADVLQPGIYFINPREKRVDIVSVGFNETTLQVEAARNKDGSTRFRQSDVAIPRGAELQIPPDPVYLDGKGIHFPSSDGFDIHMDFTAIWGILPDQTDLIRQFGEIRDVEEKVILPQIQSICRLQGSRRGAVELLVGDTREIFQTDIAEELERVLESKKLKLLFGLMRHIYVPAQVREPIQKGKIAEELKKTREQEQLTQRAAADLAEAKQKVLFEERKTEVETEKLVAEQKATGTKRAREIEADTERLTARIDADTAKIQAQITKVLREAEAKKVELSNQAKAELDRLSIETLGGPDAFNRYQFAEMLPEDLKLGIFYAGPGTFWTDLKGFEQGILGKLIAEQPAPPATPTTSRTLPVSGTADRR